MLVQGCSNYVDRKEPWKIIFWYRSRFPELSATSEPYVYPEDLLAAEEVKIPTHRHLHDSDPNLPARSKDICFILSTLW